MRATDLPLQSPRHHAIAARFNFIQSPAGDFVTPTEIAAARWAHRKLGRLGHERRVMAIATTIFDLTRPMLQLTIAHERLLRLAALLHDVGRSGSERDHPAAGAEMLAVAPLPLTTVERRHLMFLTRYHRGAVPPAGCDELLTATDDHTALHRLLALLRTADGLDNRQLPPLELTFSLTPKYLQINALASGDLRSAKRVFTRRKKFRMLENFLGRGVAVEVRRSSAIAS